MIYPDKDVAPKARWMSPCEVLCWIGYRRAIPKNTYYAPINRRQFSFVSELYAAPHDAVPGPKPCTDPMGDSEKALMQALRAARISAYFTAEDGSEQKLPAEALRGAVVISSRGSLEYDADAPEQDCDLTAQPLAYKKLRFLTEDVLRIWPAGAWQQDGPGPREPLPTNWTQAAIPVDAAANIAREAARVQAQPTRRRAWERWAMRRTRDKTWLTLETVAEFWVRAFRGKRDLREVWTEAWRHIRNSILQGEFSDQGKSRVLLICGDVRWWLDRGFLLGRPQFPEEGQPDPIGEVTYLIDGYLKRCWVPIDLAVAWLATHNISLPGSLLPAVARDPGSQSRTPDAAKSVFWTIPQALAWIRTRDLAQVRLYDRYDGWNRIRRNILYINTDVPPDTPTPEDAWALLHSQLIEGKIAAYNADGNPLTEAYWALRSGLVDVRGNTAIIRSADVRLAWPVPDSYSLSNSKPPSVAAETIAAVIPSNALSQHLEPTVGATAVVTTIAAENEVTNWLADLMRSTPEAPITKAAAIVRATKEGLPKISDRAFERAWRKAVLKSEAAAWSEPGRRKSSQENSAPNRRI